MSAVTTSNKESIIFAYRVAYDGGNAPCIHDANGTPTGILSLVVCKGGRIMNDKPVSTGLRHTIGKEYKDKINNNQANVYILGVYQDTLLYFAKVTKVLEMTEYFKPNSPYKGRKDDWYELVNESLRDDSCNHDPEQQKRDIAGRYALISNCFAYWGEKSNNLSIGDLKAILPQGQENKRYPAANDCAGIEKFEKIMAFVKSHWDFKTIIQGTPHTQEESQTSRILPTNSKGGCS